MSRERQAESCTRPLQKKIMLKKKLKTPSGLVREKSFLPSGRLCLEDLRSALNQASLDECSNLPLTPLHQTSADLGDTTLLNVSDSAQPYSVDRRWRKETSAPVQCQAQFPSPT
ncbi:hypothetical protein RRG08_062307 [Elysia crispata]|uniref:Uncharacterized protein n=1 Tax=Elysia crispata TaxID=231223 RepID=A0AAE0YG40_9GAST|nr:hypothetical protein RRG08_062307 [Elysia crispata]